MKNKDLFRIEDKYIVNKNQMYILDERLKSLLALDTNQNGAESYIISSLYFDDIKDSCYEETLNGISDRRKYRIRIYNGKSDYISLEIKKKHNGLTRKESCRISKKECERLVNGELLEIKASDPKELTEFNIAMRTRILRPKIIVSYNRRAFVDKLGNLRVTFDTDLSYSYKTSEYLNKQISFYAVENGLQILEVKYDEFIRDEIKDALQLNRLSRTSFSKYAICRQENEKWGKI